MLKLIISMDKSPDAKTESTILWVWWTGHDMGHMSDKGATDFPRAACTLETAIRVNS